MFTAGVLFILVSDFAAARPTYTATCKAYTGTACLDFGVENGDFVIDDTSQELRADGEGEQLLIKGWEEMHSQASSFASDRCLHLLTTWSCAASFPPQVCLYPLPPTPPARHAVDR